MAGAGEPSCFGLNSTGARDQNCCHSTRRFRGRRSELWTCGWYSGSGEVSRASFVLASGMCCWRTHTVRTGSRRAQLMAGEVVLACTDVAQTQHLVKLEAQISWQEQRLVILAAQNLSQAEHFVLLAAQIYFVADTTECKYALFYLSSRICVFVPSHACAHMCALMLCVLKGLYALLRSLARVSSHVSFFRVCVHRSHDVSCLCF